MNYKDKYLKYKNKYFILKKQYGGITAHNIDHCKSNPNPESLLNCGPLILYQLNILNEEQTKYITRRCSNYDSKRFFDCGGISHDHLFKILTDVKGNGSYTKRMFDYFNEGINNFDIFWERYAKHILNLDGSNAIILSLLNYDTNMGHFVLLINENNQPMIIDKHKMNESGITKILANTYLQKFTNDNELLLISSFEDRTDSTFKENIGLFSQDFTDLKIDDYTNQMYRQPSSNFDNTMLNLGINNVNFEYTYSNGDRYKGLWVNGKPEGQGKMNYRNGSIYEGLWLNGKHEGQGIMNYTNGGIYEGLFKNGKHEGKGKMIYATGSIYEGLWVNGKPEGLGTMIFENDSRYEGLWVNGKPEGLGKMVYANGNRYEGSFKNGKPEGQGTMVYANDDIYKGLWVNGKSEGKGIMFFENGNRYEGSFKNGKQEGQGTMIYANGDIYNGLWVNGELDLDKES